MSELSRNPEVTSFLQEGEKPSAERLRDIIDKSGESNERLNAILQALEEQ